MTGPQNHAAILMIIGHHQTTATACGTITNSLISKSLLVHRTRILKVRVSPRPPLPRHEFPRRLDFSTTRLIRYLSRHIIISLRASRARPALVWVPRPVSSYLRDRARARVRKPVIHCIIGI